ncbi:TraX family protein [Paenibacillus ehimensis]|uniref:TraX family protein n=1 Tax=Paenibacillus ehimensis TaxID=79264 RepID=A0ABT8V8U1_9BACL|nr:TraX family protein [Paenibacillus ehimensis]MDO3677313.1 TraX family protein [Paenibacillus ehimensis]
MVKIIAFISMFVDHLGQVFFPNNLILSAIGRIAFPLFAWGIAVGIKRTSNSKLYACRILILALISEVPHLLILDTGYLNVCFTLLVGLLVIKLYESKLLFKWPIIILLVLTTEMLNFEYGLYGIMTILIFYFFNRMNWIILLQITSTLIFIYIYNYHVIQLFSILAVMVIILLQKYDFRINRLAQYSFYPLHMLFLLFLTYILPRS